MKYKKDFEVTLIKMHGFSKSSAWKEIYSIKMHMLEKNLTSVSKLPP